MKNKGPGSMNRVYRLVWNNRAGAMVAVAESARGGGKRSSGAGGAVLGAVLATGLLLGGAALAADPPGAGALPMGAAVVAGQAQMQQSLNRLDIQQGSNRAAINWQSFNIGNAAQVNISQPDARSVLLNRVTGADPSAIHGKLTANGQVLLVNPNGIVFGKDSVVDVGGLVASTLDINDADFMAGRLQFNRNGAKGTVLNQGSLKAAAGGYVALLAPEVVNEGVVSAQLGTVALAAGDAITLEMAGSSLLGVKVDPATIQAMVDNRQLVQADGGRVILSAGAAQRLREQAVAGSAGANSLVVENGTLRLVANAGRVQAAGGQVQISGGTVDVDGSVRAATITLQADHLNQNGSLDASSSSQGGQIRIDAGSAVQTASARLLADGAAAGGRIRVDAGSNLYSSAGFSATSANGLGGDIALTADRLRLQAASIDASGGSGGGRVRVGGGYQGGGFQGSARDLANAQDLGINGATLLRADALAQGPGGQVVVWSDGSTTYGGHISAKGGVGGGDGGNAEVSGKDRLSYAGTVDLSAAKGNSGRLLLDPRNIIIDDQGSALATLDLSDPTPGAGTDNWFGIFSRVLANGNVIISAPKADTGGLADTGAVYLFDSRNGALLANLRGAQAGDQVGMGTSGTNGVTVLANGNYLVRSPNVGSVTGVNVYNSSNAIVQNTGAAAGAITWQSGGGGGSSTVGSSNSLLGSTANADTANRYSYSGNEVITNHGATTITANDALGGGTTQIQELSNGNVVIANADWYNGRGAVAWLNGSTGQLANGAAGGVLSASNALVGSTPARSQAIVVAAPSDGSKQAYVTSTNSERYRLTTDSVSTRTAPPGGEGDSVGQSVTLLTNGSYVVASPLWSNGGAAYSGAVTLGNGLGTVGAVSTGNSLVGANSFDYVGSGGVAVVGSSNYLVGSPYWSSGSNSARGRYLENDPNGAITWVSGSTGFIHGAGATGAVLSSSNSLTGLDGQALGALAGVSTSQVGTSYNYVSSTSSTTSATATRDFASGSLGTAVAVLANGNYLAQSASWNGSRGSVTFGNGNTGIAGVVSASNSLVGSSGSDSASMSITLLGNSNYLWVTPNADLGATDGGAITWGSGSSGASGALSTATSVYGSHHSDRVGSGGVLPVGTADGNGLRANYIVLSPHWGNRSSAISTTSYGAVTWADGSNGQAFGAGGLGAAVGSNNSLVGSNSGDYVGSYHYADQRVLNTRATHGFATVNTDWTAVLQASVHVLGDGNYVVRSASWDSGKGAVTWGTGSSGVAGAVSSSNSLVGSVADVVVTTTRSEVRDSKTVSDTLYELRTTGDHVGLSGFAPSGGGYLVLSPFWSSGKGAVSLVNGSSSGTVSASNSVVGSQSDVFSDSSHTTLTSPGDRLGMAVATNWVTPVISTWSGQTTTGLLPIGPYSAVNQSSAYTGYTGGITNVVVGYNQSNSTPTANLVRQLSDGNLLVASPGWTSGSLTGAGAVTWLNGSTGALTGGGYGAISSSNSLVGDIANDRIGQTLTSAGSSALANGAYLVTNTQWNGSRGAVSWGNASAPAVGVISQANSLVGGATNEQVGSAGIVTLSDGDVLIRSTQWGASISKNQAGAVTWLDAATGHLGNGALGGVLGAANSLVGSTASDSVGSGTILVLANGGYAVPSPNWDNGAVVNAGAVTFGAAGGIVGAVSAANSLVGSTANDRVGNTGLRALTTTGGTNYLVLSANWTDPYNNGAGTAGANAGAVTWVNGSTGRAYGESAVGATVSARNSLVGDQASRSVGNSVTVLSSGDAVVKTAPTSGVGAFSAVTLLPGATGLAGPLNWRNSLFGIAAAGSNSTLNFAVLPAPVSAAETVAARVLVTSGQSGLGAYGARAVALTTLGDDSSRAHGVNAVNAMADHANWQGGYYVDSAIGFTGIGGNAGRLAFSTLAGDDVLITPAALTALLNAGTDVTLQASNDIAVLRNIQVAAGGNGGNLTLDAGRSVHLRANIVTDNGDFTVRANQSVAAGVVDSGCTSCVAVIGQAPGTQINAGTGAITLNLLGSTDKASNAASKIVLNGLSAEQITVANAGLNASGLGQGVRTYGGAVIGNSSTSSLQFLFGGSSSQNGGLVLGSATQLLGSGSLTLAAADPSVAVSMGADAANATVLKATEIAAAITQGSGFGHHVFGRSNQAGATTVAALDFSTAAPAGDLSLLGGSGGLAVNASLHTALPAPHLFSLESHGGALSFGSAAAVTVSNGALQLMTTGGGNVSQSSGASLSADQLQLAVAGGVALRNGSNSIGSLSGSAASVDIKTTSSLAVAASGLSLVQDARLEAAGSSSDLTLNGVLSSAQGNLVLAAGRNFVNANALDSGLVASQGRYLVYASAPATTTEGMTGYNKHYAQSYSAGSTPGYAGSGNWFLYSLAPTLTISVGSGSTITYGSSASTPSVGITGFIDGDTAGSATNGSLNTTLSAYTPSGAGFVPVGSHTLTLNGQGSFASSLGYGFNISTGSGTLTVQPKVISLSGLSADSKVYDGTTSTTLSGTASLAGGGSTSSDGRAMAGDAVSVSGTGSGSFADRHVGNGKTVTLVGLGLSGADSANYSLSASPVTASITPKTLAVAGLSVAASKVYDGSNSASVIGSASLRAAQAPGAGSSSDGKPYTGDSISLSGSASASYNAATVAGANTVGFAGISLGGAQAGDYVLSQGSQAASITPKALTLTGLTAQNKVYDSSTTASVTGTASLGGVVGSDSVQLAGTLLANFANANAGNGKTISTSGLSLAGSAAGNYSLLGYSTQANISRRSLDVTASNASKTYADAEPTLGFTVGGLGLVGSDSVASVFGGGLSTSTGAAATAGTHSIGQGTLVVGHANYQFGSFTPGTLTVGKASLGVSADAKSKTYGGAEPTLSYSVNSAQLKYSDTAAVVSGVGLATATGSAATAGTHAITTSGGTASNYDLVLSNGTLTVAKATLGVSADAKSKTYGDSDPTLSYSVNSSQLKYSDTAAVVNGVGLATATGSAATAGTHAIAASGGTASNYDMVLSSGTLTVAKASLGVSADAKSKTYGDSDPTLSYSVNSSQLKYSDTAAVVSGVGLATATGSAATAGTHAITASGGTASNYDLVLSNGTLTVAKASLGVSADAKSKTYGDSDPTLSYSVNSSQLKYSDTAAVVSGVGLATATGSAATAGTHAIAASGGTASNYDLVLSDGTLTVAKASLVVAADAKAKTYGDADPTLSYTVNAAQLKYSDTADVVSGVALATATGAAATAGTHSITASGGAAANYSISWQDGTLSVAKAALTVTADNQSKTSGESDPMLTWRANPAQLRYADTIAVVSGLTLTAPSGAGLPPGDYSIVPANGTAANYALQYVDGLLVVKPSPSVKAENLATQLVNPAAAPVLPPSPGSAALQPGQPGTLAVRDGGLSLPAGGPTPGTAPAVSTGSDGQAGLGTSSPGIGTSTSTGTGASADVAVPTGSGATANSAPSGVTAAAVESAPRLVSLRPQEEVIASPAGGFKLDTSVNFERPPEAKLVYRARLANGRFLPAWLKLDPVTGVLSGQPPAGAASTVDVVITAQAEDGQSANTKVRIQVGATSAAGG